MSKRNLLAILIAVGLVVWLGVWFAKQRGGQATISIGVILPLTGDAAQYGKSLQLGADLAAEEINRKGGINGHEIRLLYEDSKGEPATAVSAINKLISFDKVEMVIGVMFSSTTLAIAPIAQQNRVVLLSPTASAVAVPRVGDYVFTIYPSDAYDGEFLANRVKELWPDSTRVAVVYVQAEAMITAKDAFARTAKEKGLSIVAEQGVAPGTRDLASVVTRVRRAKPAVVFIAAYLPETALFLRQAGQQGLNVKFVGLSTCYDPKLFELAGDAAGAVVFSAPVFDVESSAPVVSSFVNTYKQRYGNAPDLWAAYGFDAVGIAARALASSAGKDSAGLRNALAATSAYQGVTGSTSFNPDRTVTKELLLLRADTSQKKFVPVVSALGM